LIYSGGSIISAAACEWLARRVCDLREEIKNGELGVYLFGKVDAYKNRRIVRIAPQANEIPIQCQNRISVGYGVLPGMNA
jgi:hypothetical protein